jgi:hypothetical protein
MGGMLATGAMSSLDGSLSRHIATITMLGSGCYGAGSWHSVLKPAVLALSRWGFPGTLAGHLVGGLVGSPVLALLESAFYWRSNMEVGG